MTPSQAPDELLAMTSPLKGSVMDEPLEVRLDICSDPLPEKTAPVAVAPLRYTALVAERLPEAVPTFMRLGVLKCMATETVPKSPWTVK